MSSCDNNEINNEKDNTVFYAYITHWQIKTGRKCSLSKGDILSGLYPLATFCSGAFYPVTFCLDTAPNTRSSPYITIWKNKKTLNLSSLPYTKLTSYIIIHSKI